MLTTLSNAFWLARRQMRDQWLAYLLTFGYFAFMGGVLGSGEQVVSEFAHLVLMLILIQATLASRYMSWKEDNEVIRQQVFVRSLPFPIRTTIIARLIALLCAGLINIPVYFGMLWYAGDYGLTAGQFVAWSAFWVGMALVGAGIALIQEFWLSLTKWTALNFALVLGIAAVLPLAIWVFDFRPFRDSLAQAAETPLLLATIGLAIGVIGLVAGVLLAERMYRKREFVI